MEQGRSLTKALAIIGTILVWLPIVATIVTGAIATIARRQLRVDYLMPAELFPAMLIGGALLLWAALRARSQRALVGGSLGASIVLLFAVQAIAEVTGLASGRIEAAGWPWFLVTAALALYILSIVVLGVAGALLLRSPY